MQPLPACLEGVKIFPCAPGTKDPATTHGWKEASNDPTQIERWLRVNPDFNWAVATGLSDLFVFDIDPAGLDWWAKLLERDSQIREAVNQAFQVRTPKGGLHVYFRGQGPSTASRIAEGIDTRGGFMRAGKIVSGGYVILPGSKTVKGPGRVTGIYEALPGGVIAPLPAFMSAIVPERKKTDTLGLTKNPDQDLPRNIKTANDLIENYIQSGRVAIEGKGGDNLTFAVCASILDKAISPGLCFDLLWEKWNPHCQPPWDEWELEQKIRNAVEHGEDTQTGAKGYQSNEDAFANFIGMETPPDPTNIKPERSKLRKLQRINEYADSVGDPEWLLPDTLPRTGVGMIYGASGSFKSFVALDLSLTLAFGIEGQWKNPSKEKQCVLYFAGEAPNGVAKLRFPAWMEHWGQEFRSDHNLFIKDRVIPFTDKEGWEEIRQDLEELKMQPCLIVIDTFGRLMTGMNENDGTDGTVVFNFMEELARYYNCFVLFVHHTKKDSDNYRGTTVLFNHADTVMSLKKMGSGTKLTFHKQKDIDTEDATRYLTIEPVGDTKSIVLLDKGESVPEGYEKKTKATVGWASVAEVLQILMREFPTGTSTAILAQHIHRKHDVEVEKVKRRLMSEEGLKILRQGDRWKPPESDSDLPPDKTPSTEFDL